MSDYEDPAWDEYLSTGEDPTGGDLDDETPYEPLHKISRPNIKPTLSSKGRQAQTDSSCIGCLLVIAEGIILGIIWML